MKASKIPKNKFKRMFNWGWRQRKRTMDCPLEPRLDGKVVAITGGNSGIGLETVKGLLERGAEVIMLSRNEEKSNAIIKTLKGKVCFIQLDLGDLNTIDFAINKMAKKLVNRKIDILILNSGVSSIFPHKVSPQGFELTFAINVLGHHALFRRLHNLQLLIENARIVTVAGDIYFQANDCTSDFKYEGKMSMDAYARSKVGVMWWGLQFHKTFPRYEISLVHPGVIPMGLGANQKSIIIRTMSRIMGSLLLSPKKGAQTTLICATQADIENGAYYHNAMGKAILPEGDIALDAIKAKKLWSELEKICTEHWKM